MSGNSQVRMQTITIPCPEGLDLTKWEVVGYRNPVAGEHYLYGGRVCLAKQFGYVSEYLIVRPVQQPYEFPEWFTGWGWAMDKNGVRWLYESPPQQDETAWQPTAGEVCRGAQAAMFRFPAPQITDWTKPVINPRWRGNEST